MLGAIIGDIIGSAYEGKNAVKNKNFALFTPESTFSDDTVLTCAMSRAALRFDRNNSHTLAMWAILEMQELGRLYPDAGYGRRFAKWLWEPEPAPYGSFGNGSAMRVSPIAWVATSLEEAERLAAVSAVVTHNHPEGIKGAQAVAAALYLTRCGVDVQTLRHYISDKYYPLDFTLDDIRPSYNFNDSCQGSVPQAITAFLEADSFEDAIRNAVSLGGDSDTIAAISGSLAEARWPIPYEIAQKACQHLDKALLKIIGEFQSAFTEK